MGNKNVSDVELYNALKVLSNYCDGKCSTCAVSVGSNPYICMISNDKGVIPKGWILQEPNTYKAF